MTLILDAVPLVMMADARDPMSETVLTVLTEEPGELVVPAPISAEVDYLLGVRFGTDPRRAFLADLASGRYEGAALAAEDYTEVWAHRFSPGGLNRHPRSAPFQAFMPEIGPPC